MRAWILELDSLGSNHCLSTYSLCMIEDRSHFVPLFSGWYNGVKNMIIVFLHRVGASIKWIYVFVYVYGEFRTHVIYIVSPISFVYIIIVMQTKYIFLYESSLNLCNCKYIFFFLFGFLFIFFSLNTSHGNYLWTKCSLAKPVLVVHNCQCLGGASSNLCP